MFIVIAAVVGLALGFALGRVKNANKLASVEAELVKIESYAVLDVKSIVARVRAKL